ncbi:MAG: putative hydrolase [Gemmatimonadetes bacterium]|nr:putative hydrolase [Gemmatimonadota bacterium]
MTERLEFKRIAVGTIELEYLELGTGPLVILLHGFPDHARTWRFQMEPLAAAGFRVIAPNMRGYGNSSKPQDVDAYRASTVALDIIGLAHALGHRRIALLVGHDWGGAVAWRAADDHPEVVDRLAILNSPPSRQFLKALRTMRQAKKSWYIFFFQLPLLPEFLLRRNALRGIRASLRHAVQRKAAFTEQDWADEQAALSVPGTLTAALNYYRAAFRSAGAAHSHRPKGDVPTLILWGDRDPFLGAELLNGLPASTQVIHYPSAGHWVHWDEPAEVADELTRWAQPR